ncbi:MAG: hypothetical protein QOJ63_3799, partial [Solirubrobacteraceae bacterium]|nr:hypothetical protein [Solirubrobacteraceae bacterium]
MRRGGTEEPSTDGTADCTNMAGFSDVLSVRA